MTQLLLYLLTGLVAVVAARSFRRYEDLLQLPFLVTADIGLFLLPQLFSLAHSGRDHRLDQAELIFLGVMGAMYVAVLLGYSRPTVGFPRELRKPLPPPDLAVRAGKSSPRLPNPGERQSRPTPGALSLHDYSVPKLLIGLIPLFLVGLYGRIEIALLPDEVAMQSQWEGVAVKYFFFATIGGIAFPLALSLALLTRHPLAVGITATETAYTIYRVLGFGRRSPLAVFAISTLAILWLCRRKRVPRPAIAAGALAFMVFVANIGVYRQTVLRDGSASGGIQYALEAVTTIFEKDRIRHAYTLEDSVSDALNGVMVVDAVASTFDVDFGLVAWNTFIALYVPRQVVGETIKQDLMIEAPTGLERAAKYCGYFAGNGTCTTGVGDLFASFSYFGVVIAYALARLARRLWDRAASGDFRSAMLSVTVIPMYLRAFGGTFWVSLLSLLIPLICVHAVCKYAELPAAKRRLHGHGA